MKGLYETIVIFVVNGGGNINLNKLSNFPSRQLREIHGSQRSQTPVIRAREILHYRGYAHPSKMFPPLVGVSPSIPVIEILHLGDIV